MNLEVRSDLQGHLEITMGLEAIRNNMHMNSGVIKVADLNSEVI